MHLSLQDLRSKPHLSVSQLKTFVACPRRYWLQYVEKRPPAFRSASLSFGSAWHDAVGYWFNNNAPSDELLDVFRARLKDELAQTAVPILFDDDETEDQLVEKARAMLDTFVTRFPKADEVLQVEFPFSITIDGIDMPLIGAIDAVLVLEGKPALVELKSGKRKWGADQIEHDNQLTVYQRAARHAGIEAPDLILAVTTKSKRPDLQLEKLVRHERDEVELLELVACVVNAVRAGTNYRVRGWQCRSCAYAMDCSP